MTGFLEIVGIAFVTQLLVLPGEKVQFIIAGLATRYRPLLVVAAASAAFAGWTAVEIAFGAAIQGAFPPTVLDVVTAILFLTFAVLLFRSAPAADSRTAGEVGTDPESTPDAETDGGMETDGSDSLAARESVTIAGRQVSLSGRYGAFLPIFAMMAIGEVGDKTQIVTIGLAIQYGATPAIWIGEMLAIVPVSLANAYLFHHIANGIDRRKAHLAGGAIFLFFGLDTILAVLTEAVLAGPGFSVWETTVDVLADVLLTLV